MRNSKINCKIRRGLAGLILLMAAACIQKPVLVENLPTDYAIGKLYDTVAYIFFMRDGFLIPPGLNGNVPTSVRQYHEEGPSKWPEIVRLIEPGQRIMVKGIFLEKSFELGNLVWVSVELVGLPNSKEADVRFISRNLHQVQPPMDVPQVNSVFLQEVR